MTRFPSLLSLLFTVDQVTFLPEQAWGTVGPCAVSIS